MEARQEPLIDERWSAGDPQAARAAAKEIAASNPDVHEIRDVELLINRKTADALGLAIAIAAIAGR